MIIICKMFCGFNKKMLDGLRDFTEGLVEHGLIFKSKKNNESIKAAIRREVSDMTRLLMESPNLEDPIVRNMVEGLVKYVMNFFLLMRKNDLKDYKEIVQQLIDFFDEMDKKYYGELEGKSEDMKEVIEYLNTIKI